MLTCGIKICPEHHQLGKPVITYIKGTYRRSEKTKKAEDYAILKNKERYDWVTSLRDVGKPEIKIDQLIESGASYYSYLKELETRFRVSNARAGWGISLNPFAKKSIYLQFTWTDAFNPALKFTSYDLKHELASILLVLASLNSHKGVRLKRENEDEIKKALHSFQQAAGILDVIETMKLKNIYTPKSGDLHPKLLSMMKETMIAQAQECVFEACLRKKIKPISLAAIALGVADKFRESLKSANGYQSTEWLKKCNYPWAMHLKYKILCWDATAIYYQSRHYLDESEWGTEIACLQKAQRKIKQARNSEATMRRGPWGARLRFPALDALEASAKNLEEVIAKRLKKAIKENDAMYHARIKPEKISALEGKILAKAAAFVEPPVDTKTPFADLIPAKIQEHARQLRQQMKDDTKKRQDDAEVKAEEIRTKLQALNLPGALEAREGKSGIPDPLWTRIAATQTKGGVEHVDKLLKQVLAAQDKSWEIFNATKGSLDQELNDDEKMRTNFGGRWTRAPSKELTLEFSNQLQTVEGYLKRAAKADEKLSTKRRKESKNIETIMHTRAEIEAKMPKVNSQDAEKPETPEAKTLKEDLAKLNKIIEARPKILELAEKKIDELEIELALLEDKRNGIQETVTNTKMWSQMDPYYGKLTKLDELQATLLSQVESKNDAWKASVSKDAQMQARSEYLGSLNSGVEALESLSGNLVQGLRFYGDCMSEYLNPLRQQVRDFVVAREHEKKMYMEQITRALATAGSANGQNIPKQSQQQFYGFGGGTPVQPTQPAPQPPQSGTPAQPTTGLYNNGNPYVNQAAPIHVTAQPFNPNQGTAPMQVEAVPVQASAPPGPSAPGPSATVGAWSCPLCTYQNAPSDRNCAMCNTKRP